jgi:hypothetical protein
MWLSVIENNVMYQRRNDTTSAAAKKALKIEMAAQRKAAAESINSLKAIISLAANVNQ